MKTKIRNTCSNWTNNTDVTLTEVTSGTADIVVSYSTLGTGFYYDLSLTTTGNLNAHPTNCHLMINRDLSIPNRLLAQSIGEIFGLNLLTDSDNSDSIMYYPISGSTTISANDKKGLNVITGLHTTHSWIYTSDSYRKCSVCGGISTLTHAYHWFDNNSSTHRGYCMHCQENVYESHQNYVVNNRCKKCGRTGDFSFTQSIDDEEE